MSTVCLSIFHFSSLADRLWVFGQMAYARFPLSQMRDLQFYKLLGSGTEEGFTPKPNTAVWGMLTVWPDEATARAHIASEPLFRSWRKRAAECWTVYLDPIAAKGKWGGKVPFTANPVDPAAPAHDGPMVALTRAQVKLGAAVRFWNRVPKISDMIGKDPNILFKIGMGETPLFYQMTFSIWPDSKTMAAFARGDTPHAAAIKAAYGEKWFVEDFYARFRLLGAEGSWEHKDPLAKAGGSNTLKEAA
ncbi:spheroidene monooxygenase [Paracoccaceae bacterium Fryx2]|nr:spheroidene monooxygenase [Paracoccaceae bacterium Fryx2]